MRILHQNNFWTSLSTNVGVDDSDLNIDYDALFAKAVRKDPHLTKEDSANILGEDSGVLFSNRFVYDEATHNELVNKINDLKVLAKKNFNSTKLGKKLEAYQNAANEIKEQVLTGKTVSKPKVEKKVNNISDEDEEDILAEIERETEEVNRSRSTSKAPGKSSPSAQKTDVKQLATELSDAMKNFCNITKQFAMGTLTDIEKSIEHLDSYRGDTLGETYRRVVVPKEGGIRGTMEEAYIAIGKILDNTDLQKVIAGTPAYKILHNVFLTESDMTAKAKDPDSIVTKPDFLELQIGSDEFAKDIFKSMADTVNKKGPFSGKMGNFQITETNSGDFIINNQNVSRNSLDDKYEEFVELLVRASLSNKLTTYFKALNEREDFGAELNKYICLKFMELISGDIKKQSLENVYRIIEKEFAGTEFVNLFKSVVKNLEFFTASIENVENDRVTVDKDASLQIYEAHGEYYVTLFYGSLPPETFSLDRIAHRGYSNAIIKGLATNRNETLQDLYKKLMNIKIRNEVITNRLSDPSQSKYRTSKYFGEIMREIEGESKMQTGSKMKYFNIIKKVSQFVGSQGHPAYDDDPLSKFTVSTNYKGVSLFVDFIKTSDSSFRISNINFVSGDRKMGAMLINALNNKSGSYNFNAAQYKDISSLPESKRREIYRNITSFYTKFLTGVIDAIGTTPAPAAETPASSPSQVPASPAGKKYTKEELIDIYHQFNLLSDKDKRTPAEDKKLAELSSIVEQNIAAIREYADVNDAADLDELEQSLTSTQKIVKSLPRYEQNKMLRQLDTLHSQLESSKSNAERTKIQGEIDRISNYLIENGADFSDYRGGHDEIDNIADKILNLSITDVDPANKTRQAAINILKNHPSREEFKENARENLDKYPYLKGYLEHIYSPEFVRLVYAD